MSSTADGRPVRVTVWNEGVHEARQHPEWIGEIYPDGMHGAIAAGITEHLGDRAVVRTATLASEPDHGLTEEVLAGTDVLLWWGHAAHEQVDDEVVARVHRHVLGGMGFVGLHSAHYSKIFTRLLGTTCSLAWRNEGERELVWTTDPSHPIARGVANPIVIEKQEMYGEPFGIPHPDEVVFLSTFAGGEVFRSGVTYQRGLGRVFYFSPGDQEYPVYQHPDVRRVIANAVVWAHRPEVERLSEEQLGCTNPPRRF